MLTVRVVIDVDGIVDVEHALLTQYALVDLQCEHGEHHHTEQRQHDDFEQEAERLEQRRNDGLQTCSDRTDAVSPLNLHAFIFWCEEKSINS